MKIIIKSILYELYNMKIALVFHGISHGYNEKGDITNISKDTFQSIINNLLDSKNINYDTYFHSWNSENNKIIIDIVNPKKYELSDRINFEDKYKLLNKDSKLISDSVSTFTSEKKILNSIYSRFYSLSKSVNVVNNIDSYDMIILSRFDIFIKNKINIENFNKNTLNIFKFNNQDNITDQSLSTLDGCRDYWNKNILDHGVADYMFIGNPENIKLFTKIYDNLPIYLKANSGFLKISKWPVKLSGHSICKYHIDNFKIKYNYIDYSIDKDIFLIKYIVDKNKKCDEIINNSCIKDGINFLENIGVESSNEYNKLAYLYYQLNDYNNALKNWKKSLSICENKASLLNIIIVQYIKQNNDSNILDYCKRLLKFEEIKEIRNIYNKLIEIN